MTPCEFCGPIFDPSALSQAKHCNDGTQILQTVKLYKSMNFGVFPLRLLSIRSSLHYHPLHFVIKFLET